ncbi:MAG: hypothetical protein AABX05_02170 [Nanoarchaeota archaeon]
MRYFKGESWQEMSELPDDAVLLVRSTGLDYVRKVEEALRNQKIPYFIAAERKDEVNFYVEKDRRDDFEKLVKAYLLKHN